MKVSNITALVLAALLAIGCSTVSTSLPGIPGVSEASPQTSRADVEYTLGTGDAIRLIVFGEPEMSGDFVVDGSGLISVPLLGQTQAAGMSVPDLETTLQTALKDNGILRDPQVNAEVTNYRPFYILGEVNRPGQYAYTNGLTVMNAVATAQGFTYRANRKRILVTHADAPDEVAYRLTPETRVLPGDTIRVVECLIC